MATLSLRIREDLRRKAQELAQRQGVSLNNYINAALAATVAQAETLAFFDDRLKDIDLEALRERVLRFMEKTQPGREPSVEELTDAMGIASEKTGRSHFQFGSSTRRRSSGAQHLQFSENQPESCIESSHGLSSTGGRRPLAIAHREIQRAQSESGRR